MKQKSLYYIPVLFIFWMFSFTLLRVMFYWVNVKSGISFLDGELHGLPTDVATTCYLIALPALLWLIGSFYKPWFRLTNKISFTLSAFCFVLVCFIDVASLPLFPEWGTSLNLRAVSAVESPHETAITVFDYFRLKWLLLLLIPSVLGVLALWEISQYLPQPIDNKYLRFSLVLLLFPLLFVGMRGGIDKIPIQVSSAFYSNNQTANFLAVNKTFYFVTTLKQKKHLEIESRYFDESDLANTYCKLYGRHAENDSSAIFTTSRPNIVLIVLEGCPADVFEPLGGIAGITPNFGKLCNQGLLFSQVYASGFRTDQGLLNLLSGVPALPFLNLMSDIELSDNYPSILTVLNDAGYYTSFMYGGDADFSNFDSYFLHNNTDKIVDKQCFPKTEQTISWGVPDDLLLNRVAQELNTYKEPFFSCIMTQTSHPPFDLSGKHHFPGNGTSEMFKSCVYFTDSCIASFIEGNQHSKWYKNTVFIVISDHGSLYLGICDFNDHNRFRIPLLMVGEALKNDYRGKTIANIGNSHDLPTSLLSQLQLDHSQFALSKNLLVDSAYHHAYWITEQNIGWITAAHRIVFNFSTSEVYFTEGDTTGIKTSVNDGLRFYKMVADYALKNKLPPHCN